MGAIIKVKEGTFMKEQKILYPEILDKLYDYQIQSINVQVEDYLKINVASETYHFNVCPKCGISHPNLRKNGRANSGKPLLQCKHCGKRFVVDHGQLTFYSHQSQDKWNTLITDTLDGVSLRESAKKLKVHECTVFNMRHKFLHVLEEMVVPIYSSR